MIFLDRVWGEASRHRHFGKRGGMPGSLLALLLGLASALVICGCGGAGASVGGNSPQLTSSSASADFGNVTVGSSGSQSITLTNTGTTSLTITQANVSGTGFSVTGLSVPLTLAAGQSVTFTVKFSPSSTGPVTGTVSIVSSAPGPPTTITLNANALPPPAPQVTLNPATVSFGNVLVGTSGSQAVTLANSGNANLAVTQVTVSGTGFSLSGLTLPLNLAPSQQTTFNISYSPSAPGAASGSISVVSNASSSPNAVPLAGAGVQPAIAVNPPAVAEGNVLVGSSATQTVTLTNTGTATLNVTHATMTGNGFSTPGLTMPLAIAPGQSSNFSVQFAPTSVGNSTGSISLDSNAPNSPTSIPLSGNGVAPTIGVNPNSLAFGNVNAGSSSSLAVMISNTGNTSLTLTQANVSGAGFSTTGLTLPLNIPAGQNSSFNVKFAPASAGNVSGSLSLVSNAPTSPTAIPLSGTGVAPTIGVSPASLPFGNVNVGSSSSLGVTISNTGNASLSVTQANLTGAGFSTTGLTLPVIIPAGQNSNFNVQFAPGSAGSVTGSLSLVSNAPNSPTAIPLSGNGVAVSPGLTVNPTSLAFGNVNLGSSSQQTLTLTNSGNATLIVSQANVTGSGFSAVGLTLPLSIPAGQSSGFNVQFAPASAGQVTGSLSLVSSAPNSPTNLALSGNGVALAPAISASPSSLSFGNVNVGSSGSLSLTVTNTGNATLSITQANVTGTGFTTTGLTLPLIIPAGQNSSFNVQFAPTTATNVAGSLSLVSNSPTSPTTIPLSGSGVAPAISVNPASLSFGNVSVGSSSSLSLTVTNSGNASLTITQANVTGAGFTTTGLTLPLNIPAGQSGNITVRFAPTSAGSVNGSLSLVSNAPTSPTGIPLSGTGTAPAISVNPVGLPFGNVNVGSSGSLGVTISNAGNADLVISTANVTGSGFSTTGLTLPLTIPAGQNSSFNVQFAPASAGSVNGSLSLVSNALTSPTGIPLSGTGIAPAISVNPASLAFGNVLVGNSSSLGVTLTNTGNASLTITQANLTGAGFSTTGLTLPLNIPAGQNSGFNVQFAPGSAASVNGSLSLVSNAPTSPTGIPLSGTGVAAAVPAISVNPTSLAFGNVNVGSSSSLGVTVTNTGNATLSITQANVSGASFSTTGLTLPLNIPAGQNSNITVQFAPAAAGNVNGNLSLVSNAPTSPTNIPLSGTGQVSHYIYLFPDGAMKVFDMDNGHQLIKTVSLPQISKVKGVVANTVTRKLYISYGGTGDGQGNGSLVAYDLMTDQVLWNVNYSHGIDSMAITPDGKTIYMPDGEASPDNNWYIVDASNGSEKGFIVAGTSPHNTMVSLNGAHVYLGGRDHNELEVAATANNQIIMKIGPLIATNIASGNGVRPFTITGKETFAFTTASGFLGFQVSDITTGNVLYTVSPQGFSWDGTGPSTPSHGISLSPDEKEIYVLGCCDTATKADWVHVYDVTGLPALAPRQVADIKLNKQVSVIGWLQHSRDGRFVYVGDAGDVIDTATRIPNGSLPISDTLYINKMILEIDWSNGVPVFAATSRSGMGYVTQ